MFQVRLDGRGGQGVVTAAELLSIAGFTQGKHAQAFPSFGSERTGAPVVSFCRLDDKETRLREPILEPDCVIVQAPTLFHAIDVFQGLKPGGHVLINSGKSIDELGVAEQLKDVAEDHIRGVNATELAIHHVGPSRSARIRSAPRRISPSAAASLCAKDGSATASSSTSKANSQHFQSRSVHRQRARAAIQLPPARASCSWLKRSTTQLVSAFQSS